MNIDQNLVRHIAKLARIDLDEAETEMFRTQLAAILNYVEKMSEVSDSADPFVWGDGSGALLRPDEPVPSLSSEEAIQNSADRKDHLFRVPQIIP